MHDLQSKFISENGDVVDYSKLRRSREFNVNYRNAAYELRKINLNQLDDVERKCLFINIYNTLLINAIIVFGEPKGILEKRHFFYNAKYDIGGFCFSLNDIEHGILRCNKIPVGGIMHVFTTSDPRLEYMVKKFDPRIHMALNCGAKSCPPIRIYTTDQLDYQLDLAARSFCESEVQIDEISGTITLSKIFQWYFNDFGTDNKDMVQFIQQYLTEERKRALQKIPVEQVTIRYSEYDWSLNSTKF